MQALMQNAADMLMQNAADMKDRCVGSE